MSFFKLPIFTKSKENVLPPAPMLTDVGDWEKDFSQIIPHIQNRVPLEAMEWRDGKLLYVFDHSHPAMASHPNGIFQIYLPNMESWLDSEPKGGLPQNFWEGKEVPITSEETYDLSEIVPDLDLPAREVTDINRLGKRWLPPEE